MSTPRVVVDGSNIATEGRSLPSLAQLDEAVRAFVEEFPQDVPPIVVVDATFGHRIDESERDAFDEAVAAGEMVAPPAGGVGRGDAFILQVAEKADAVIFSNDSFQEFHGEHDWLFESGRLIGGKPVAGVGWIFQPRVPVRGPKSRMATRQAKGPRQAKGRGGSQGSSTRRGKKQAAGSSSKDRAKTKAKPKSASTARAESASSGRSRRRRRSTGRADEPVNAFTPFIEFVGGNQRGSIISGEVTEYSSHGAYVMVGDVRCYIPNRRLGDPPPRAAREVLAKGTTREFVIAELDPPRRAVELGLPDVEVGGPSDGPIGEDMPQPDETPPVEGYDDLRSNQVAKFVADLSRDHVVALRKWEIAHRERSGALAALDERLEELPSPKIGASKRKAAATKKPTAAGKKPAAKRKAAAKKKPAAKRKAAATKKPAAAKKKPAAKRKAAAGRTKRSGTRK